MPVDDVRVSNPPSHPDLHRRLGEKLAASDFDIRELIREICASATYQANQHPNEAPAATYAGMPPRRLTAEQMLDAIGSITEVQTKFSGVPLGQSAIQIVDANGEAQTLRAHQARAGIEWPPRFPEFPRWRCAGCGGANARHALTCTGAVYTSHASSSHARHRMPSAGVPINAFEGQKLDSFKIQALISAQDGSGSRAARPVDEYHSQSASEDGGRTRPFGRPKRVPSAWTIGGSVRQRRLRRRLPLPLPWLLVGQDI